MTALVFELANGFLECGLQLADLAYDKLWKAQEDRCVNAAFAEVVDDLLDIGGEIFVFGSPDNEIAFAVNAEIAGTPILNAVGFDYLLDRCAQLVASPI